MSNNTPVHPGQEDHSGGQKASPTDKPGEGEESNHGHTKSKLDTLALNVRESTTAGGAFELWMEGRNESDQ